MKKTVLILLCCCLLCSSGLFAGILSLDELTLGTFYDIPDGYLFISGFAPILNYKKLISLDIGLAGGKKMLLLAGLSLDMRTFCEKTGLDFAWKEDLKVGFFIARDFKDDETKYGPYVGLIFTW